MIADLTVHNADCVRFLLGEDPVSVVAQMDTSGLGQGVEDSASMKRLKELGCTYGQGYLFGRPMPAADAGRLLVETGAAVMAAE